MCDLLVLLHRLKWMDFRIVACVLSCTRMGQSGLFEVKLNLVALQESHVVACNSYEVQLTVH
jgi:hypothetical protein